MGELKLKYPNAGKSYEEYLQIDESSELRSEYVYGEIFAMAGASMNHNQFAGNLFFLFRLGLKNSKCRTYMSDMRLEIQYEAIYYYPDVILTCSETDLSNKKSVSNPILLVEVLSKSTADKDLHDKLQHYLKIPSLQYYMVVAQDEVSILLYERTSLGWGIRIFTNENDTVDLPLIGMNLAVNDIFEGAIWEEKIEKRSDEGIEEE